MELTQVRLLTFRAALATAGTAAMLGFGAFAAPAGAATIPVICDPAALSTAIDTANTSAGPDTLDLASSCNYSIANPPADTNHDWYGPSGLPAISSNVTIEGHGSTITRSGVANYRLFFVGADPTRPETLGYTTPGPGQLALHDLTVSAGRAEGGDSYLGGGGAGMGGAIFNQGTLTMRGVTLSGNAADGGDAGAFGSGHSGGAGIGQDAPNAGGTGGGFGVAGFAGASGGSPGVGTDQGGGGGGDFAANDGFDGSGVNGGPGGKSGTSPSGLGGAGRSGYSGFLIAGGVVGTGGATGDGAGGGAGNYSNNPFHGGLGGPGGGFGVGGGNAGSGNGPGGGGVGGGGGGGSAGGGGGFGAGGGVGGNAGATDAQRGGGGGYGGGGADGTGPGGFGGGTGGPYSTGVGGGGAGLGGAIFNMQGVVTVVDSTLSTNTASGGTSTANAGSGIGGAIFDLNGTVSVYGSTFTGNTASTNQGDLFVHGYDSSTPLAGGTQHRIASGIIDDASIDDASSSGGTTPAGTNLATATITVVPAAPTVTSSNPVSGSNNNSPLIIGAAPALTTVKLYTASDCTGALAATGTAADFGTTGLPVSVADNSTTDFYATATLGSDTSRCSPTHVTYAEVSVIPAAPTVSSTNPPSGSNNNSPHIIGTAQASTTVKLYTASDCSGSVAATGTASDFGSAGLQVSVADNSTTDFYATATLGPETSTCSATHATYAEVTPPLTPPTPSAAATGQRAAALKKCKKKKTSKARKKCKKKAQKLPV
jgi:hypothetical protein